MTLQSHAASPEIGLDEMKLWLSDHGMGFCTLANHPAPIGSLKNVTISGAFLAARNPDRVKRFRDAEVGCETCLSHRHTVRRSAQDYVTYHVSELDIPQGTLELITTHHLGALIYRYGQRLLTDRSLRAAA